MDGRRTPIDRRLLALLFGMSVLAVVAAIVTAYVLARGVRERQTAERPSRTEPTTQSAEPTETPRSEERTPTVPATTTPEPTDEQRRLDAYTGLGAWVDIFDDRAFDDPEGTVAELKRHGVKTLFLETGNSEYPRIFRPDRTARFITAAHEDDIYIVAWFLPWLQDIERDYASVKAAIQFETDGGERFDSFTLDIESTKVRSVATRSRRAVALSRRIRQLVGRDYVLGGCIPSPVGIKDNKGFWNPFPYEQLAQYYDVWVPMGYYTFHGNGAESAYADARRNMRLLRAEKGLTAKRPVHLVGGLAEDSTSAETRSFLRAAGEQGAIGASLYDWATMNSGHWRELQGARSLSTK